MGVPPPIVFPQETFHIHKQILPLAERARVTVGRMGIILRYHGKLAGLKSQVLLPKHHISLPAVAVPNLQKIMKM